MRQTVVGVFDRYAAARQAAQKLRDSGFGDSVFVTDDLGSVELDKGGAPAERRDDTGVLAHVRSFFADLFGDDEREVGPYAEALQRGGAVVKVEVDEQQQAETARSALAAAGAIDIQERAAPWHASSRPERRSLSPDEPLEAIDETPVPQSADASAPWRTHFDLHYAQGGSRWEDYEPAYRYGDAARADPRYVGRAWEDAEPELQRDWDARGAGPWERFKAAVRHAWDRMTE